MNPSTLKAISPIDGRYATKTEPLRLITSEYGLIKFRLMVEIEWYKHMSTNSKISEVPKLSKDAISFLDKIIEEFDTNECQKIKEIEQTTNHDVKAVEYYLKNKFRDYPEEKLASEFIHFGCTSEDINNLAYALMLKEAREYVLSPILNTLINQLEEFCKINPIPMLSRTHGQAASPTTVAKEIFNFVARLKRQTDNFANIEIFGKFNGATGNYNAHIIAYPEVNWLEFSKTFVENLGLTFNAYTTQIEPHDYIAEMFHNLSRINTILIGLCRDIWGYISIGYFTQKVKDTEIGSSTMPHKVNPIDFENAEGNFGIANALYSHFSAKLPISRWQRDLSDSTVLRNVGVALSHNYIAIHSLHKGLSELALNGHKLQADLNDNWEVLSEAIQTVMRRYNIEQPYEKLKELTRGKKINQEIMQSFISNLELPEKVKETLNALEPKDYIGLAQELTKIK